MSDLASNGRRNENVWDYPRPPALEKTPLRLRVVYTNKSGEETILADTTNAYRVLETSHPPTYYIPPSDVKTELLTKNSKSSFCEWKGNASYYNLSPSIQSKIWSYATPNGTNGKFSAIAGYLSFYASAGTRGGEGWKCYVEDELVVAQDGDFYGGWKTAEIVGKMKGGAGTWGW